MCRARCITHQGRVISATGMHNHQSHMKGSYPNSDFVQSSNATNVSNNGNSISISMRLPSVIPASITSTSTTTQSQSSSQTNAMLPVTSQHQDGSQNLTGDSQSHESNHTSVQHSPPANQSHLHHNEHMSTTSSSSLQNMMQNVLSQNSLMTLTNMVPILNPTQGHPHLTHVNSSHLLNELHPPSQGHENNQNLHSPDSPRNSLHHAQLVRAHMTLDVNRMAEHQSMHTHQHQHHHHHHPQTQSNENNDPAVGLPSPNDTQHQEHDLTPLRPNPIVHHSLENDLINPTTFKLEQI